MPGREPTRFNPGDFHGVNSGFETLYLALDGKTALFEKQVQFGDPYGPPEALLVTPKIGRTSVVPVDVNLDGVLDLSDVNIHDLLETNAQEITGDWRGYQIRGPNMAPHLGVLSAPAGLAPTQQLA